MSPFDLLATILVLAAAFGVINHRFVRLPPTVGIMAGALVCSLLILAIGRIFPGLGVRDWVREAASRTDPPRVFLDGILAFMLFAGSLHVDLPALRTHKFLVFSLATLGVLIATALFAAGMWLAFAGAVPFAWCVVLGAIAAPTDPIAVIGMLKRLGLPPALRSILAAESLFNDGVAVVVFTVAVAVATGAPADPVSIARLFGQAAIGGTVLGLATGLVSRQALRLAGTPDLALIVTFAEVAATYSVAHGLEVSGLIAVVVAGLVTSHDAARTGVIAFWGLADELLNAILFLMLGFSLLSLDPDQAAAWPAVAGIALAIAARLVSVAAPAMVLKLPGLTRGGGIALLTWGGLRGGLSVAMALSLAASPWRGALLSVCYAVVVFTIVAQGLTMPWLLARIGRGPPA